jgi:hypothetical protein
MNNMPFLYPTIMSLIDHIVYFVFKIPWTTIMDKLKDTRIFPQFPNNFIEYQWTISTV